LQALTTYTLLLTSSDNSPFLNPIDGWALEGTSDLSPATNSATEVETLLRPDQRNRAIEGYYGTSTTLTNMPALTSVGDTILLGTTKPPADVVLDASGSAPTTVKVEYWSTSGWTQHPNFSANGNSFAGLMTLSLGGPSDWATQTEDGGDEYLVRLTALTAGPLRVATVRPYSAVSSLSVAPTSASLGSAVWADHAASESVSSVHVQPLPLLVPWIHSQYPTQLSNLFLPAPIRPSTDTGAPAVVHFTSTTAGLSVTNTHVPVAMSLAASTGVTASFPGGPLTIQQQNVVDGGRLVVANGGVALLSDVATATDMVVRPLSDGVETIDILRNASAPHTLSWQLSSSAGPVSINLSGQITGTVGVNGVVVAELGDVWAMDANGVQLPVTVSATGSTLSVVPDLSSSTIVYPVVVDPGFTRQTAQYTSSQAPWTNFNTRVRGWNMDKCIENGDPCMSANGSFRAEATAQSHAIRHLAISATNGQVAAYGYHWVPNSLDWEVSINNVDGNQSSDDEPACDDRSFRMDIALDRRNNQDIYGKYRIAEVKNVNNMIDARVHKSIAISQR
jgi:hypothetical protein